MSVRTTSPPAEHAAAPVPATGLARWMPRIWWVLGVAVALEAVGELTGYHEPDPLFVTWLHSGITVAAAVVCLAAVREEPRARGAWLAFGVGLAVWATADVFLECDVRPGSGRPVPNDLRRALGLAGYPITGLGMALLIRAQLTKFELHRWLDGIAVMLILLIPAAVFILEPVAERTHDSTLAEIVDFSYPILDLILLGAILGVFGVTGWRPGRVWLTLAVGIALMTISDATFAVQQASGSDIGTNYDFLWSLGTLMIAYAAWLPISEARPRRADHRLARNRPADRGTADRGGDPDLWPVQRDRQERARRHARGARDRERSDRDVPPARAEAGRRRRSVTRPR